MAEDAELFESLPADTFSFHSTLGKSCIMVEDKRANSEICGFQLQGSDKTCFNTKCTIRAHRTPEASSPVVKPGLYFRSGPSGIAATRVFNSPVADLYSDLLSRIEEYKAPTWHNILNLMAELEDVAHCENQVRRITSVIDKSSEDNEDMSPFNSQDENSEASEGDDTAELDQALFRSTQKRTLIPNTMSIALAGFERLVVALG